MARNVAGSVRRRVEREPFARQGRSRLDGPARAKCKLWGQQRFFEFQKSRTCWEPWDQVNKTRGVSPLAGKGAT
jgi:hypothetical protein